MKARSQIQPKPSQIKANPKESHPKPKPNQSQPSQAWSQAKERVQTALRAARAPPVAPYRGGPVGGRLLATTSAY